MNKDLLRRYRWHRGRTGCVGHDAEVALLRAQAEIELERRDDLRLIWEPEEYVDLDDLSSDAKTQVWIKREYDAGRLSVVYLRLERLMPYTPKCAHCGRGPDPERWDVVDSLGNITLHVKTEADDQRVFEAEMLSTYLDNKRNAA